MDTDFSRTFFITTVTWARRPLFISDPLAAMLLQTLQRLRDEQILRVHSFVIMPDHLHVILTPSPLKSLERSMQFLKGRFSFRVKKELGNNLEIWEKSFTNHRVRDMWDYTRHREYIHQNPVKCGLVTSAGDYQYSSANPAFLLDDLPQRLKPQVGLTSVSRR